MDCGAAKTIELRSEDILAEFGYRLKRSVTTGEVWIFGKLHRRDRLIVQNTKLYLVPDELETLMRILVQALN